MRSFSVLPPFVILLLIMHFKIVAVIKRRGATPIVEYSYVPHKWEKKGLLYWPKSNLKTLREDVESEPGKDWQQFRCKVKKTDIIGLEEAELWEEQYVNASETDAEDSLCIKKDSRKEKLDQIAEKSSYNKLFDEINSSSQQSELIDESNTVHEISVGDTIEFNPKVNGNIQTQEELPNKCCCNGSRIIIEVHEEMKKNTERQERMLQHFNAEFLQLKLTSDSIYKIMKDIQAHLGSAANKMDQVKTNVETVAFSERFLFPLNSQSDILEFNNELVNNDEYKTYLVKKFTSIGGSDGSEDGKIVARKLLAILFSKYVLTLFSWTGISRTKGLEKKESFQSCQGILTLFQLVLEKADSRWNQSKNEKFFKSHILKHAKQINEAHEKKMKKKEHPNSSEAVDQENTEVQIDSGNYDEITVEIDPEIERIIQDFHPLGDWEDTDNN